jgi:hypothetical protein
MAYLYRHIRKDKNEVFYVGIGSDKDYKRAYVTARRNKFWNIIHNKSEIEVEIMIDNIDWEVACEKEKEFINLYGRRDLGKGTLVNLTDGGDGTLNRKQGDEEREWRKKFYKENNGFKGKKHSEEAINKMRMAKLGTKISRERVERQRAKMIGKCKGESSSLSKLVLDLETGIYYFGIREASDSSIYKVATLGRMLNGKKQNKTNLKLV